jgi:transcriptional regulator with XRE-family HTH domain
MPVSAGRHNLARLRKELNLTQAELATLVGCSPVTIKAVEIGKLALSEGLATRIALSAGTTVQWLLENDLNSPVPVGQSLKDQYKVERDYVMEKTAVALAIFAGQYLRKVAEEYLSPGHSHLFEFTLEKFCNQVARLFKAPEPKKVMGQDILNRLNAADQKTFLAFWDRLIPQQDRLEAVEKKQSPGRRKARSPARKSS